MRFLIDAIATDIVRILERFIGHTEAVTQLPGRLAIVARQTTSAYVPHYPPADCDLKL